VTEDKNALIVPDDEGQEDSEETLSESLGGFQALILFAVIALFAAFVFAFPTPFNPAVTPPDDGDNLVEALGDLDAETEDTEDSDLVETLDELDAGNTEPTEEAEAVVVEPTATVAPTEAPTEEPTEAPTETLAPTEEPTLVPTEFLAPTDVPTEIPAEDPTASSEPTSTGSNAQGMGQGQGFGRLSNAEAIAMIIDLGDEENGELLFNAALETSSGVWMCSSCHAVDEAGVRLVGPPLWGLYAREERVEEARPPHIVAYTEQSIVMPQAYIVPEDPPYPENLMPQNYGELLSEEELQDVIAYLLSLGHPDYDPATGMMVEDEG
jgi:hypothetical protein